MHYSSQVIFFSGKEKMRPVILFSNVWEFLNGTFNNLDRYVQELSLLYNALDPKIFELDQVEFS